MSNTEEKTICTAEEDDENSAIKLDEFLKSDELNHSSQFYEPVRYDKLLPVLNAKTKYHVEQLKILKEKRNTRVVKLQRNISKVEKLTLKVEKLEDINRLLSELHIPGVKSIIDKNQNKIKKIREEKIPSRESKIEQHKKRITEIDRKSQVIGHKLERCVALSNTIKSFTLVGKERRQIFSKSLDALNKSTYDCLCDKRDKLISKRSKEFEKAKSLPKIDRILGQRKINEKYNGRIKKIENKISKINLPENFYENNIGSNTDKIIDMTQRNIDNSLNAENISVADMCENICVQNATSHIGKQIDIKLNSSKINDNTYNIKDALEQLREDFSDKQINDCIAISILCRKEENADAELVKKAEEYVQKNGLDVNVEKAPCNCNINLLNVLANKIDDFKPNKEQSKVIHGEMVEENSNKNGLKI